MFTYSYVLIVSGIAAFLIPVIKIIKNAYEITHNDDLIKEINKAQKSMKSHNNRQKAAIH